MSGQGRVDHLDGIRALAIGAVIAVHWVDDYTPVGGGGHLGVHVFFALSGWIITTILWRGRAEASLGGTVGAFLLRRCRRLLPALAGLVVVTTAVTVVHPLGPYGPGAALRGGLETMLQLTWTRLSRGEFDTLYGHTWSLGVEWLFYLLWPWLLLGLRARGVAPLAVARLAGLLAVVLYAASFAVDRYWFTYGPLAGPAVMLAGSALALAMLAPADRGDRAGRRTPSARVLDAAAVGLLVAFAAYVVAGYETFDPGVRRVGVPLATLTGLYLVWYGYRRPTGVVTRLLTLPAVTLLGRVSYSLYLFHLLAVISLDKDEVALPLPVLGLLAVLATAVLTTASYLLLERPFMRPRGSLLGERGSERATVV